MAMEAEYSLPQHTSTVNMMSHEDNRRHPPEPYASSAIYTELNYQVFCRPLLNKVTHKVTERVELINEI